MDVDASIEQVTGILVREGLRYAMSADGRTHRLLFGSAGQLAVNLGAILLAGTLTLSIQRQLYRRRLSRRSATSTR